MGSPTSTRGPARGTATRPRFAPFRVGVKDPEPEVWLTPGEFQPDLDPSLERTMDWEAAERDTPRGVDQPWRAVPRSWTEAMTVSGTAPVARRGVIIPKGELERRAVSLPSGIDQRTVMRIRRRQPQRVRIERRVYAALADLVFAIGALWLADEFLGGTTIMTKVHAGIGTQTFEQVIARDRPATVWIAAGVLVLLNSVIALGITGRTAGRWLAGISVRRRRDLAPPGIPRALLIAVCAPLGPLGAFLAWRNPEHQTIADAVSDTAALTD